MKNLNPHIYVACLAEEAKKTLDECYHGEFKNYEDFAYYWMHEVDGREIPEYLDNYIDYKSMAREVDHNIHVFSY